MANYYYSILLVYMIGLFLATTITTTTKTRTTKTKTTTKVKFEKKENRSEL